MQNYIKQRMSIHSYGSILIDFQSILKSNLLTRIHGISILIYEEALIIDLDASTVSEVWFKFNTCIDMNDPSGVAIYGNKHQFNDYIAKQVVQNLS